jgi:hypothetical protein
MFAKTEREDLATKPSDFPSNHSHTPPPDAATSAEVADYIADLLQELQELSRASGQAPLSLLLELAQREARRTSLREISINQSPIPPMAG